MSNVPVVADTESDEDVLTEYLMAKDAWRRSTLSLRAELWCRMIRAWLDVPAGLQARMMARHLARRRGV